MSICHDASEYIYLRVYACSGPSKMLHVLRDAISNHLQGGRAMSRTQSICFYNVIPHPYGNEVNVVEISFCVNFIPQVNI